MNAQYFNMRTSVTDAVQRRINIVYDVYSYGWQMCSFRLESDFLYLSDRENIDKPDKTVQLLTEICSIIGAHNYFHLETVVLRK